MGVEAAVGVRSEDRVAGVGERVLGVHFVGSPSSCWLGATAFQGGRRLGVLVPVRGPESPPGTEFWRQVSFPLGCTYVYFTGGT